MKGIIETLSGEKIDVFNPKPEQIHIEDIAAGLSNMARFGGQTHTFYSVAEHSVRVSLALPEEQAMWGLLHDATEAYLLDMPKPLKQVLKDYRLIETGFTIAIAQHFELPAAFIYALANPTSELKIADEELFLWERDTYQYKRGLTAWTPAQAKTRFLRRYEALQKEARNRIINVS